MSLLAILLLALVQGIAEFLPISSSAHLILAPRVLGWADQGLAFDIAVHVGSLAAVVVYFRGELLAMVRNLQWRFRPGEMNAQSHLAFAVIVGTLPAVIVGAFFKDWIETTLRSPWVIAATTAFFGVLLGLADWRGARSRDERALGIGDALVVGLAQALALIPGTSRSGATITAGLFLGLSREGATRFSFLLSIPVICGAGLLQTMELLESGVSVDVSALVLGALFSGVSAYLCIHFFLSIIERLGMMPFVAYRLGLALLIVLFVRSPG